MSPLHDRIKKKIFVAIPTQRDGLPIPTVNSLISEALDATDRRWAFHIYGYPGIAPISAARNISINEFMASDCTDYVSIDDDLAWDYGALCKNISHEADFVAGIYPQRQDKLNFPVQWVDHDEKKKVYSKEYPDLIEVWGVGFGFIRIKRHVIEKMLEAYKHLQYDQVFGGQKCTMLFDFQIIEGRLWSEDFIFCKKWRDIGGKLYANPNINFLHIGPKGFQGHLGKWLEGQPGGFKREEKVPFVLPIGGDFRAVSAPDIAPLTQVSPK